MVRASASSEKYKGNEVLKEKITQLRAYLSDIAKNAGKGFYVYITVLIVFIFGAAYMEYLFVAVGGGITNSSDFVPWGIFLVAFVFFVGTSAGATIIGLMIYAFGRDDYKPLAIRGIIIGLVSLLGATLNLLLDSGTPLRGMMMPTL